MAENSALQRPPTTNAFKRLRGRDVALPPTTAPLVSKGKKAAASSKRCTTDENGLDSKRTALGDNHPVLPAKRVPLHIFPNSSFGHRSTQVLADLNNTSLYNGNQRQVFQDITGQINEAQNPQAPYGENCTCFEARVSKSKFITKELGPNSNVESHKTMKDKGKTSDDMDENLQSMSVSVSTVSGEEDSKVFKAIEQLHNLDNRTCYGLILADEETNAKNTFTDIDSNADLLMCGAYAPEIFHYLRTAELKRRPATTFMEEVQNTITADMRGILVDWLVEVADEYKLFPETLYLAVSYIDRFLSANVVPRQELQLLGVACMLVASKFNDPLAPQVEEFCYITDNTYNRSQVLQMEVQVLKHFRFELSFPTAKSFLKRFVLAAQADSKSPSLQLESLASYLAELTLLEYSFLCYLPSMVAASAVFIAMFTVDPTSKPWNQKLLHYTGYNASDLKECASSVQAVQMNAKQNRLPAVPAKYRQHKFKCVASLSIPNAIPVEYFEDI